MNKANFAQSKTQLEILANSRNVQSGPIAGLSDGGPI